MTICVCNVGESCRESYNSTSFSVDPEEKFTLHSPVSCQYHSFQQTGYFCNNIWYVISTRYKHVLDIHWQLMFH